MTLGARIERHFGRACVAVATLGLLQASASGAILSSGIIYLNIPTTTQGVYLNVVTGVASATASQVSGWDLNLWGTTTLSGWTPNAGLGGGAYVATTAGGTTLANISVTMAIGANSLWCAAPNANATNGGFTTFSSQNFIGFRFLNEATSGVHYGVMRINLGSSLASQPRYLVEYMWESIPGQPFQIPAPGAIGSMLLAIPIACRVNRRRH